MNVSSLLRHLLLLAVLSCGESVSIKNWLLPRTRPPTRRDPPPVTCLEGDGSSYRGSVSVSARGFRCLHWAELFYINDKARSHGLGYHNHCRNYNRRSRPWCLVKAAFKTHWQYCDVPKCETDPPTSPATTPALQTSPSPALETGSPTSTAAPQTSPSPAEETDAPTSTPAPHTSPSPAVDTERTCGVKAERRFKIVGGSVTPIESQPWTAAIFVKKNLCGGSLIAPCWVLTAAHCLFDPDEPGRQMQPGDLSVFLGKSATNQTDQDREQRFAVEQLVVHQDYNNQRGDYDNDIALLKLQSSDGVCAVRTASVRTACLPPPHTRLPPGSFCNVVGYGKDSYGAWEYTKYLKQASVETISDTRCKTKGYYGNLITDNMFCAGSPDWSADACQGDSGGPLVCEVEGRAFVFGVVSWGEGCALKNKPGVYTRITNYNSWISEKTGLPAYTAGAMYPPK